MNAMKNKSNIYGHCCVYALIEFFFYDQPVETLNFLLDYVSFSLAEGRGNTFYVWFNFPLLVKLNGSEVELTHCK